MFVIQYEAVNGEHRMQELDSKDRQKLLRHLARFEHPIVAVYEQASTNHQNNAARAIPLARAL